MAPGRKQDNMAMRFPMRYFNGRIPMRGIHGGRGLICARTKTEAVQLGRKAFGMSFTTTEFKNYWSECWGGIAVKKLGKEQLHSGAYLEIDEKFFKFEA